jgi:hypothetical protein
VKAGVIPRPSKRCDGVYQYGEGGEASTRSFLPVCVRQWLGVTTEYGGLPLGAGTSLADKNDQGWSFEQIADLVVEHASVLFGTGAVFGTGVA